MKVLVDFDNIPLAVRNQGVVHLADRILNKVWPVLGSSCKSLELRLYSGWDENGNLTIPAQRLTAELRASFPKILKITETNVSASIFLHAEIARSLSFLPKKNLPNTLRHLPFQKRMKCSKPTDVGCKNAKCPLDPVSQFLNSAACPVESCAFTPSMIIKTVEQKLVDTMIVTDLIHFARAGEPAIGLVSSDDDLWPGILSALNDRAHVVHLQTLGAKTFLPYRHDGSGKYTQLEF